jgi:hypothetical protein
MHLCCPMQEQLDQLQRQLAHVTAREAGLQAEVDAYQLEHSQLLAANTQLVAQCTNLNREVQVGHCSWAVRRQHTWCRRAPVLPTLTAPECNAQQPLRGWSACQAWLHMCAAWCHAGAGGERA